MFINKYTHKYNLKITTIRNSFMLMNIKKSILFNERLPKRLRMKFTRIKKRNNILYFTTLRNRCLINGNSRAVYSKLNLSRIPLKTLCFGGYINGFFRSSW